MLRSKVKGQGHQGQRRAVHSHHPPAETHGNVDAPWGSLTFEVSAQLKIIAKRRILGLVGWLEFNVPFQHKYGYIRDERSGVDSYPLTQ